MTGTQGRRTVLLAHPVADRYGSDRMLLESVRAMVDAGWRTVLTVPADGPLVPMAREVGAETALCPVPRLSRAALTPRGALDLVRAAVVGVPRALAMLRRIRPDVVYVSTVTIPLWTVLARLSRVPVVVHVHEAEQHASRAQRTVLFGPLVLASLVVANSRFTRTVLTGSVRRVAGRTVVVENGVEGPQEPTVARERPAAPVRLLYVGRLSARKGVDVAVRALSVLRERGTEAELHLAGAVFPGYEWYDEELDRLVLELGLVDRVHRHGFVEQVWEHVAAADVVLVPSRAVESFGNAAVEAVLGARPVVASAVGGLAEAVTGYASAHAVRPDDPVALADAVTEVLDGWSSHREDAWQDAARARARHDTGLYRARVARLITRVADGVVPHEGGER